MHTLIKPMKCVILFAFVLSILSLPGRPALAQENPMNGVGLGIYSLIFGKERTFSATLVMTATAKGQKQQGGSEDEYAFSKGNVRMEEDLTRKLNGQPKIVEALKKDGLERVVYILRPDKNVGYLIVPGKKAYTTTELPKEDAGGASKSPKLERKELGKETFDGHPCIKQRVTITTDEGDSIEYVTWEATDLGGLPIRLESQADDIVDACVLKKIKTGKLDLSVFEVPAGYKKMSEQESTELRMTLMQLELNEFTGQMNQTP